MTEDNPYEVIKVLEAWGLDGNFCLGKVVKYIARADKKGKNVEDLKKAAWYLEREIKKLEGLPDPNQPDMFNSTKKETENDEK